MRGNADAVKGVRLLGARVLLRRVEETTSAGGVALPDSYAQTANRCVVVAVGDGVEKTFQGLTARKMRLKVGDVVLVDHRAVFPLAIGGVAYPVVDEDDVLAVLE